MVGEGVLHECLLHPEVENVLVINRKPCGVQHPKLKEVLHKDFFDLTSIEEQLKGYHACFFCLGVSSVGLTDEEYHHVTYNLTVNFAKTVLKYNPGMTFCYVSGSGTNSNGSMSWARIKGKTENEILKLGFKDAYAFRPAYMQPTAGLKNTLKGYWLISWFFPVLRLAFPGYASTLKEVGIAMINVAVNGSSKKVLEVKDIVTLAAV